MLWYNFSFTLHLNAHRPTSSVQKCTPQLEDAIWWLNALLFLFPPVLLVCVHVLPMFACVMFLHSLHNFLNPTVYMHSGFMLLSKFLYFCGFLVLRVALSVHVPLWMCLFLCICVWLQIVVCFDVYVRIRNIVKYNFYLCLAALHRAFTPLCVCLRLCEPLTGLPCLWPLHSLHHSHHLRITYITRT